MLIYCGQIIKQFYRIHLESEIRYFKYFRRNYRIITIFQCYGEFADIIVIIAAVIVMLIATDVPIKINRLILTSSIMF